MVTSNNRHRINPII